MNRERLSTTRIFSEFTLVVSALLVGSLVVGTILAIAGVLEPWLVAPLVLGAAVAVWLYIHPAIARASWPGVDLWPFAAALVLALSVTALNLDSSAEHLQTNRDPGVYLTTGKWLANNGTLLIDGTTGGFADVSGVEGVTGGYHEAQEGGLLYAQFNHGFPVLLAMSEWIGGDRLMLNLNPLIGGAFLVFLFLLLARFVPGWIALLASAMTGLNLVFWHFTRDTYSEPLVALLLVLGLIWVDQAMRTGDGRFWFVAGLMVGATAIVRVDAWIYVAIFTALIAVGAYVKREDLRYAISGASALVGISSAWAVAVVGFADLAMRSPRYLSDLWSNVRTMLVLALVSLGVALSITAFRITSPRRADQLRTPWAKYESVVRVLGVATISAFTVWLFVWRPQFGVVYGKSVGLVGGLMEREGLPVDPTRRFFEYSGLWLTWYWGWPAIVTALTGFVLVIGKRRWVDRWRLYFPVAFFGLALVPYLVNPSITPDHLWAMRRFYPMALPGISIAAAIAATLLWSWLSKRMHRALAIGIVVVGVIPVFLLPGWFAVPLATASTQVGMYRSTTELCDNLPDDAAVLFESGEISVVFVAAVRSFCDVPVASLTSDASRDVIEEVRTRWEALGRELYVVGPRDSCLIGGTPSADSQFEFPLTERTLTRRPANLITSSFAWVLSPASNVGVGQSSDWALDISTIWVPPDSSSIVASQGPKGSGTWWLEYRPTGLLELWVNTGDGPVGVGYPIPLDDGRLRTIPFGFDDGSIFIGCGANLRTAPVSDVVSPGGCVEMGKTYAGAWGNWEFLGHAVVEPSPALCSS